MTKALVKPEENKDLLRAISEASANKSGAIFLGKESALIFALYAKEKLKDAGIETTILTPNALYAVQINQTDMREYLKVGIVIAMTGVEAVPLFLRSGVAAQALMDNGTEPSDFYLVAFHRPAQGHKLRKMLNYGAAELRDTPESGTVICSRRTESGGVPTITLPKDTANICLSLIISSDSAQTDMETRRSVISETRKKLASDTSPLSAKLCYGSQAVAQGRSILNEGSDPTVEGFEVVNQALDTHILAQERVTLRQNSFDI